MTVAIATILLGTVPLTSDLPGATMRSWIFHWRCSKLWVFMVFLCMSTHKEPTVSDLHSCGSLIVHDNYEVTHSQSVSQSVSQILMYPAKMHEAGPVLETALTSPTLLAHTKTRNCMSLGIPCKSLTWGFCPKNIFHVASFPGHSQILSHSRRNLWVA